LKKIFLLATTLILFLGCGEEQKPSQKQESDNENQRIIILLSELAQRQSELRVLVDSLAAEKFISEKEKLMIVEYLRAADEALKVATKALYSSQFSNESERRIFLYTDILLVLISQNAVRDILTVIIDCKRKKSGLRTLTRGFFYFQPQCAIIN